MSLLNRAQEIFGDKTFTGKVIVEGDFILKRGSTYYSPRPSEVSWGTKRGITPVAISGTYTASGTTSVDVSSLVPTGTKAVTVEIQVVDATANTTCRARATGGSVNYFRCTAQVANIAQNNAGDVPLDSSRMFDINNSAAFDTVTLTLVGYYI